MDRPVSARACFGQLSSPVLKGYLVSFIAELWMYLRVRKKLWLLPLIIVMLAVGGLFVLAQGSAFAPFIYTLF